MANRFGPRATPVLLWAALLGAVLLVPHLRPISLILLPGLLIHAIPGIASKNAISALVKTLASSLAFWIVSVWAASCVGIQLSTLFFMVTTLSGLLWLAFVARNRHRPSILPRTPIQITVLISALILTLLPFFLTEAPPGADMSMHGYLTRMVIEAGGIPDTYEPYIPIKEFGAFSVGLQTLAALVTSVSSGALPILRALLLVDCLVYFLFFLFLWAMLNSRFSVNFAAIMAAVGTFLSRNPQHFIAWGGTPTVLSIALIACAVPALRRPREQGPGELFLAALCLSAAFLAHPMPALILATIYVPYAAYLVFEAMRQRNLLKLLTHFLIIGAICLACTSFFMVRFENRLSFDEDEWMQVWGNIVLERWQGTLLDAPITLPRNLAQYALGFLTLPLAFALLIAIWLRKKDDLIDTYFVLAILGIIVNSKFRILPHSVFLFPDRAAAMLPVFATPLIGGMLIKGRGVVSGIISPTRARQIGICLSILLAAACASGSVVYYLEPGLLEASVTKDDLKAFEWIEQNTPAGAHIANNYSDAGIYLPMMTRRSVTVPHVNIINWSETKLAMESKPAQFIYVGARNVYPFPFEWTPAVVESLRPRPRLVFQSGDAYVYEIEPSVARSISANYERLVAGIGPLAGEISTVSPVDGAVFSSTPIVLKWDPSSSQLFNIQLSLSPNFGNPLLIYNSYPAVQIESGHYDISPLIPLMPPQKPVYWRIRGLAPGNGIFESKIHYFIRE
ncbi:hypothetical protein J7M28_08740 [bacterium]|nr:hypothetical protein [bacterium]